MNGPEATVQRAKAVMEASQALDRFAAKGLRIILEAPKPLFKAPPYRCADWFNRNNPICKPGLDIDQAFLLKYRQPALDALRTLAQRSEAIAIWDPFPILCPAGSPTCQAIAGATPLFFDGDHISPAGNARLLDAFAACMEQHPRCGALASE